MWKELLAYKDRPERWITLIYILAGSLWILFSDRLLLIVIDDPVMLTRAQTYKGWAYVAGSGLLIYFLLLAAMHNIKSTKTDLKKYQKLQQSFFDNHPQPLWQSDAMGHCIYHNIKWVELTGKPIVSDKPFAWLNDVHPDDRAFCIDKFTNSFIKKTPLQIEYRLLTKDGTFHWVLNHSIVKIDTEGNFDGFNCFLTDIEEKKQLEHRYRDSSRRYGYLFANNPNPMLVYDTQDYKILETNKAALNLYGYDEKEFLSLSLMDLRPSSEVPNLMDHLAEELPEFHRSSGWVHKKKNGTLFDAEVTAHSLPVLHNRKMRLVIIKDITEQIKAFRAAKEGERRFRTIFTHNPQGTVICDAHMEIADINPAACKILNIQKEKAIGAPFHNFFNDESQSFQYHLKDKLSKGLPVASEAYFTKADGVIFRVVFHAIGFTENETKKTYIAFSDIDEKHKMEVALKESERVNSTLVTNLPGMVYRCKNDRLWSMIYVSFGVQKLTGYTAEDIVNNKIISYHDIIYHEDKEKVRIRTENSINLDKKFDLQYRIVTKEGAIKWVWEQTRAIRAGNGNIQFLEGFIIDITGEKEALEKLAFQKYFLSLIIENIPFPFFYKNFDGKYEGCNKAFCEFLGRGKDDIVGKTVFDIFEKKQAQLFFEKDKKLLDKGGKQVYESRITFPDGREMDALFHKAVFHDSQYHPLGIIGIYLDITERVDGEKVIRRQLEELSRVNSELEQFSYTVSHDLRTPLVTIKGFLGLLKEDMEEENHEQVKEDIQRIENATDKMHQLLEDLLKLSRAGKMAEQSEKFSMSQAANEAYELVHGLVKEKKCKFDIQKDMPLVKATRSRIRELYQNLMENAIKFCKHQQNPSIKIYSRQNGDEHVYYVKDNGIGIEKSYHKKVFGLFSKLDNNSPGTGIGLSLVKKIVENHHGRVWVESDGFNAGTTVCFTLNTEKKHKK